MSGGIGKAIAEVALNVAVSAGKRALKEVPKKTSAVAGPVDKGEVMAKFLQLRSKGSRGKYETHGHAAAKLACMQDLRPGALEEREEAFLEVWRKSENVIALPCTACWLP